MSNDKTDATVEEVPAVDTPEVAETPSTPETIDSDSDPVAQKPADDTSSGPAEGADDEASADPPEDETIGPVDADLPDPSEETDESDPGQSPSDAPEATDAPQEAGPATDPEPEGSGSPDDSAPPAVVDPVIAAGPPAIKAKSVASLPDDLSPEDFANAIEQTVLEFSEGDIVEGKVVNIDHDEVMVDIGYKSEGVILSPELSMRKNVTPDQIVEIGEVIEALVLDKEDDEGRLILSKKRAQYERAWGKIEALTKAGQTVNGLVIEVVKGGLIVDIGLRGFLPASLVELRRVRDLDPYIGETIEAKVIELDRNRNNVVLSRRAYLEEEQAEQRQSFLDDLHEGEARPGTISSVVNFGAFVDLGGMDGLVHVSELSWQHVNHPSEVVKVGDEVSVKVLEVDRDRERISLSIKQTQTDPWEAFSGSHDVGDTVDGVVTKTVPFGAFVSVGDGVEGLVHVSEIAMHRVESPELELSLSQAVKVKITEMDEARRRVSLSIKQAMPDYEERSTRAAPRRKQPEVREFEREDTKEEERTFDVDSSLEAILQELKERGIGRR